MIVSRPCNSGNAPSLCRPLDFPQMCVTTGYKGPLTCDDGTAKSPESKRRVCSQQRADLTSSLFDIAVRALPYWLRQNGGGRHGTVPSSAT